ncbi:MAG: hypothetical protein ACYCY6_01600 [Minisyncoccota bacterium]
MDYKSKKSFLKRVTTVLFAILLAFNVAYNPVLTPKANAFLGVGDINLESIPTILKFTFQEIGRSMANKMLDDMVKSTIEWANSGFEGNPSYAINPEQEFRMSANDVVGRVIDEELGLGFLCSPFQAQIRLSIQSEYTQERNNMQCTLEEIGVNLDNFYNDFDEGGWDAWIKMTQEDQNNPYGAFLSAKTDIDREVANTLAIKQQELNWGNGMKSFKRCLVRQPNIPSTILDQVRNGTLSEEAAEELYGEFTESAPPGTCIEYGPTETPGSVISNQLNKALGTGLEDLVTADDINSIAGALINGLLTRFVFPQNDSPGLFSNSSRGIVNEIIDIDDDGIPDGYDSDGDGELNVCHHGRRDETQPASNENCIASKGASNSPFFVPICEAVSETTRALESYLRFIDGEAEGKATRNLIWKFQTYTDVPRYWEGKDNFRIWQNRTINVHTAADGFINTLSRYEARAFNPVVNNFGRYSRWLDKMIESLVRARDVRNDGLPSEDDVTIFVTKQYTLDRLEYLMEFSNSIGQCDNPNIEAITNIPLPPEVEPEEEGAGGDTETPTTTPTDPSEDEEGTEEEPVAPSGTLSCSPFDTNIDVGEVASWLVFSTYPTGTEYEWSGDDFDPEIMDSAENLTVVYDTTGTKTAQIEASFENGSTLTRVCVPSIFVSDSEPDQ